MVVKLILFSYRRLNPFESCVVLDGSQTGSTELADVMVFESCVVLDGSQTNYLQDIEEA